MTEQVIDTPTEPAPMTPATRFLRTLLQVVIAMIPAVVAIAWANLPPEQSAILTGALVTAVSAIHNAINQARSTRTAAHRDAGIGALEVLVIVFVVIVILILLGYLR